MNTQKYKSLVEDFLNTNISVDIFVQEYQNFFLKEPTIMEAQLFWILEKIFESAEAYYPDCKVGEETRYRISEERLREEVLELLVDLEEYLNKQVTTSVL